MARKVLSPLTLVNLATAPSPASAGDTYYDTVLLTARTYTGSAWVSGSGGSSFGTQATVAYTTSSLAALGVQQGTVAMAVGYRLVTVTTDRAARVRVYASLVNQAADVGRPISQKPTGAHGVLLDLATSATVLSFSLSPQVTGDSEDPTPSSSIPITVTNNSGSASTVTATIVYVRTE